MQMVYAIVWDDAAGIPYSSVQFIKKRILFTFTWYYRQKFTKTENQKTHYIKIWSFYI